MEYYNKTDTAYLSAVSKPYADMVYRIQPLDHWENAIGEITAEISRANDLSVSASCENGVRRSCAFSLINTDGRFTLSKNADFWYNRKFRILAGVKCGEDIYEHSQGVFICEGSRASGKVLSLTGIDKFGNLTGELNVGKCVKEFSTKKELGDIYVAELIRHTLMIDIGNGLPIDPVPPLIDPYFETATLYADITLSIGQYYGEIITKLADMYGADVYYNTDGRLVFRRKPTYNIPSFYSHIGHIWRFEENDVNIMSGSTSEMKLDGINAVTVSTDNSSGDIYSYTARNENAESPLNVKAIGERYPDEPVVYISIGDTDREEPQEKCKQYAEFLLMQSTMNSITENFTATFIPHFDVGKVIFYKGGDYVINSLSIDMAAKTMQVQACNTMMLPTNDRIAY